MIDQTSVLTVQQAYDKPVQQVSILIVAD